MHSWSMHYHETRNPETKKVFFSEKCNPGGALGSVVCTVHIVSLKQEPM